MEFWCLVTCEVDIFDDPAELRRSGLPASHYQLVWPTWRTMPTGKSYFDCNDTVLIRDTTASHENQNTYCNERHLNSGVLQAIDKLSENPDFSLTVVSMAITRDKVNINYLTGKQQHTVESSETSEDDCASDSESDTDILEDLNSDNQENSSELSSLTSYDEEMAIDGDVVKRDLELLKIRINEIIPSFGVETSELRQLPRLIPTDGAGAKLICVDRHNRIHYIGRSTVTLVGDRTSTLYAISVGNQTNIGDKIYIQFEDDEDDIEFGEVIRRNVRNEIVNGVSMYVDAALIKLKESISSDPRLKKCFKIDEVPHVLRVEAEQPKEGRVLLRAVDQTSTDRRGWILSSYYNLLQSHRGAMHCCTQIARFNEHGGHNGCVHNIGESGTLGTYEPTPDRGTSVPPVVMLIATIEELHKDGRRIGFSIGIDISAIMNIFSTQIGEALSIWTDPIRN